MELMHRVLKQIQSTASLSELWTFTIDYFTDKGFGGIGYMLLRRGESDKPVAVFSHGLPEEFSQAYADRGYASKDPAVRHGLDAGQPFTIDQLYDLTTMTRQEEKLLELTVRLSIAPVLILPVFGPNAINGVFGLSRQRAPGVIVALDWKAEQIVAQTIHTHILTLQPKTLTAMANPLSERELEILRWVAQGKSNSVIADVLDLSASTVDTYLRRIFNKLDVADRTTAAVRGVSCGYIHA